jgi:hypothetical protein
LNSSQKNELERSHWKHLPDDNRLLHDYFSIQKMKPIAEIAADEMGDFNDDEKDMAKLFEQAAKIQKIYCLDEAVIKEVSGRVIFEAKSQGRIFYRELKCDPKTPNS